MGCAKIFLKSWSYSPKAAPLHHHPEPGTARSRPQLQVWVTFPSLMQGEVGEFSPGPLGAEEWKSKEEHGGGEMAVLPPLRLLSSAQSQSLSPDTEGHPPLTPWHWVSPGPAQAPVTRPARKLLLTPQEGPQDQGPCRRDCDVCTCEVPSG
jgi:hypothetical protein